MLASLLHPFRCLLLLCAVLLTLPSSLQAADTPLLRVVFTGNSQGHLFPCPT